MRKVRTARDVSAGRFRWPSHRRNLLRFLWPIHRAEVRSGRCAGGRSPKGGLRLSREVVWLFGRGLPIECGLSWAGYFPQIVRELCGQNGHISVESLEWLGGGPDRTRICDLLRVKQAL